MLFLVGKGVGLPRIHASVNSLWVERVHAEDSYFSVVSYEKLIGEPIGDSLWNETLFRIPLFLQLREVLIYTVAKKMLDLDNLTPIQARLLSERGNRIRKNQTIVDLEPVLKSL